MRANVCSHSTPIVALMAESAMNSKINDDNGSMRAKVLSNYKERILLDKCIKEVKEPFKFED